MSLGSLKATLWRLDDVVRAEWSMERFGRPGTLCFADTTQPGERHAEDLRLYQAGVDSTLRRL